MPDAYSTYIDNATQRLAVPEKRSKELAWELLQKRVEESKKNTFSKFFKLNWFVGSMAAAAVMLAILYLGMFNTGKYSPSIYTEVSQLHEYYLPDSSLVVLNSNSSFKYHYNNFTGERNVVMKGEAFFDVQKGRKFSVEFQNNEVKVLGTKFNILAYSNVFIQVDCAEGKVQFNKGKTSFTLNEGEGIKIFKNECTGVYKTDPVYLFDRLTGIYYWEKVSLDEIFLLIGYRFGYNIELDEEIAHRNFSGKIDLANLRNGLSIISYAMELKYSIDEKSKTIIVNAK